MRADVQGKNRSETLEKRLSGIGMLVSALITTVGPELQQAAGQAATMRGSVLVLCALLISHTDPTVRQEALGCYQQLHLFAPRHVQLDELVTLLCVGFLSVLWKTFTFRNCSRAIILY